MNDAPVALSDEELSEEDAIEQSVSAMFDDDGEEVEKDGDGDSPKEVIVEAEDLAFIDEDKGEDDAES